MLEQLSRMIEARGAAKFGRIAPVYAFTTERLSAYFPLLPFGAGRVLSVGGSGDHVIDAALAGARDITIFDLNILARHWFELKRAALLVLDRSAFLRFLGLEAGGESTELDLTVYERLRSQLSDDAQAAFERLYVEAGSGPALRASPLFHRRPSSAEFNRYLSDDRQYGLAAQALAAISLTWRSCGLLDVVAELPDRMRFDVILLSNIADYSADLFPNTASSFSAFTERVLAPLYHRLTRQGRLCAAYLYDIDGSGAHSELDDREVRRSIFNAFDLPVREAQFPGIRDGTRDAVLVAARSGDVQFTTRSSTDDPFTPSLF